VPDRSQPRVVEVGAHAGPATSYVDAAAKLSSVAVPSTATATATAAKQDTATNGVVTLKRPAAALTRNDGTAFVLERVGSTKPIAAVVHQKRFKYTTYEGPPGHRPKTQPGTTVYIPPPSPPFHPTSTTDAVHKGQTQSMDEEGNVLLPYICALPAGCGRAFESPQSLGAHTVHCLHGSSNNDDETCVVPGAAATTTTDAASDDAVGPTSGLIPFGTLFRATSVAVSASEAAAVRAPVVGAAAASVQADLPTATRVVPNMKARDGGPAVTKADVQQGFLAFLRECPAINTIASSATSDRQAAADALWKVMPIETRLKWIRRAGDIWRQKREALSAKLHKDAHLTQHGVPSQHSGTSHANQKTRRVRRHESSQRGSMAQEVITIDDDDDDDDDDDAATGVGDWSTGAAGSAAGAAAGTSVAAKTAAGGYALGGAASDGAGAASAGVWPFTPTVPPARREHAGSQQSGHSLPGYERVSSEAHSHAAAASVASTFGPLELGSSLVAPLHLTPEQSARILFETRTYSWRFSPLMQEGANRSTAPS
jgi:hypothetical protein